MIIEQAQVSKLTELIEIANNHSLTDCRSSNSYQSQPITDKTFLLHPSFQLLSPNGRGPKFPDRHYADHAINGML